MFDVETDFTYWSRRARQEEVAAINARSKKASRAHRRLSALQAARAVLALLYPVDARRAPDPSARSFCFENTLGTEAQPC